MPLSLFLCGDVMTGRGIDQVLRWSCPPRLYEPAATSAQDYVAMAERAHGPIPRPVSDTYIWGEALAVLARERPDARIINLETSITLSEAAERKGINYRMHPGNVPVLQAAGIDCCALANNHVLDWGRAGLMETVFTLERAGIAVAGAGADQAAAEAPAVLNAGGSRVLVFAFGSADSGIPGSWAADVGRPGVHLLRGFSEDAVEGVRRLVAAAKGPGDLALASIHWGSNWGFEIPEDHRRFAHELIERAAIDIVHGHSSHHPRAIEVYRGRPILYGCGDLLNDYEGITGYEEYRDDLALMYFVTMAPGTSRLARLRMVPLQIRNFRLQHPGSSDRAWLASLMDRECRKFGGRVEAVDGALELRWA